MTQSLVKSDPFDSEFRRQVAESIGKARRNIKIVTGEISAYNYFELRNAAEEAARRGVKIDVYAASPDRDTINRLIHHNINVYTSGMDLQKEHFMIIDGKKMMISKKRKNRRIPTPMGERIGVLTTDRKNIINHMRIFDRLKKTATKEKIQGQDPLEKRLKKQDSLGQ